MCEGHQDDIVGGLLCSLPTIQNVKIALKGVGLNQSLSEVFFGQWKFYNAYMELGLDPSKYLQDFYKIEHETCHMGGVHLEPFLYVKTKFDKKF